MSRAIPTPVCVPYHYLLHGHGGWFVVHCKTMRIARSWGVREFGRGGVRSVRQATTDDVRSYCAQSGRKLPLPREDYPND